MKIDPITRQGMTMAQLILAVDSHNRQKEANESLAGASECKTTNEPQSATETVEPVTNEIDRTELTKDL
jgi:hypothetical protein